MSWISDYDLGLQDGKDQAAEAERAAVVADMRETAQNMRRYPYESAAMAEAMVFAARAIQDLADRYERRAHLEMKP